MNSTILIVDDDPQNIDILTSILEGDYVIKATTNGMIALKIAQKTIPDLILLDVMMPIIDGYEVCKQLKSNIKTKDIPIIFITAKTDVVSEAKGFELGAVDYVTKPVTSSIVKARVRNQIALANQKIGLAHLVEEKTKELQNSRYDLIKILGIASDYRDSDTGLHILRMSKYARIIALQLGLSFEEASLIELVAPMHDVGKIGISDNILLKPGRLSEDEYNRMKEHCEIGYKILNQYNDPTLLIASKIALEHHERFDGSGYPFGIEGKDIDLLARIVSVADVFDALTSDRPYKEAWSFNEAFDEIVKRSGSQFDNEVVDAFIQGVEDIKEIYNKYKE